MVGRASAHRFLMQPPSPSSSSSSLLLLLLVASSFLQSEAFSFCPVAGRPGVSSNFLRSLERSCRHHASPAPRLRVSCQLDGGLGKEFENYKKTSEQMEEIFKKASNDLQSRAKEELDSFNQQVDEIMSRREEEWELLGAKAAESLVSKVDDLAENFLKGTGRGSKDDDDDEFADLQKYLGPQEVAVIGPPGVVRDEIMARLGQQQSLKISSCEKLLETRGMTIENSDTLIFVGNDEPLDRSLVERLIARGTATKKIRRVVLLSSLGTLRSDTFPFSMQNAFSGVLDKKRDVELGIQEKSKAVGFSYSIVRVGKINADQNLKGVMLKPGDDLVEDINPCVAAEAVLQSMLFQPSALNASMSIIGEKSANFPTQTEWDDEFLRLDGPELFREPLGSVSATACMDWVKTSWAPRWEKSGSGLTTPVKIVETANGVQLVFRPPKSNFVSFKEEKEAEKAREKGDMDEKNSKFRQVTDKEGGVEVVVEDKPFPRVRALRCNMGEETVIKETSEKIILSSLRKDVSAWIAARK